MVIFVDERRTKGAHSLAPGEGVLPVASPGGVLFGRGPPRKLASRGVTPPWSLSRIVDKDVAPFLAFGEAEPGGNRTLIVSRIARYSQPQATDTRAYAL